MISQALMAVFLNHVSKDLFNLYEAHAWPINLNRLLIDISWGRMECMNIRQREQGVAQKTMVKRYVCHLMDGVEPLREEGPG